jgi:hypothetical protein
MATMSAETPSARNDVTAVQDFMVQVSLFCARLMANPFDTPAAEALLDLLLDEAPAVDLALERVMHEVISGPLSNGTEILNALSGCRAAA